MSSSIHRSAITTINPISESDRQWVSTFLDDHWGSTKVISRGQVHYADRLSGFIAWQENDPLGLITYYIEGFQCEIITINSLDKGKGIGTALIQSVREIVKARGCKRLWLITTNDNLSGLAFYQKRGFRLVALHKDAVNESRNLKPEIPLFGQSGIAIRDEIELEIY